MKKYWLYILAALLMVPSCVREMDPVTEELEADDSVEGKKVTITFNVTADNLSFPTKALGETGELNNLYLAVFGRSGYLKEYVQANPLGLSGTYQYTDLNGVLREVPCYAFTARLTLSTNYRSIHFIGNAPESISFDNCEEVLPKLMSDNPGDCSFWQMIEVNHISAKKWNGNSKFDSNGEWLVPGDYIDINDNKITDGTGYIPDDYTAGILSDIPLIRNWSKIVVMNDTDPGDPDQEDQSLPNNSYFTPYSYAVISVPTRGSLVPHCSKTGFVRDYQTLDYDALVALGYTGNLPDPDAFDTDLANIPSDNDFKHPEQSGGRVADASDPDAGVYLYERPVPTDKIPPTYVIIYGYYHADQNPDDDAANSGPYYYKVDLMTGTQYYPIFRNFKYQILINKIRSKGHPTPAAAVSSAGSADVSADINARHLADISDGVGRLVISPWMSHTFVKSRTAADEAQGPILFATFVKNVSVDTGPSDEADIITVEKLDMARGLDDVIDQLWIDSEPTGQYGPGVRAIHFTMHPRGDRARSQTIRVTGTHAEGSIYRDVVITLQPYQEMRLSCISRVLSEKGSKQILSVSIPDGLGESMFPLDFIIEPEDMTLSPDVSPANGKEMDDMPVSWGESLSGSGKRVFRFTKTLSWDEYMSLSRTVDDENGTIWKTFDLHFQTNCNDSATTIRVQNEFFNDEEPMAVSFTNYEILTFRNCEFTSSIPREAGQEVTAKFTVTELKEGGFPQISLKLTGLGSPQIDGDSETPVYDSQTGRYYYTPKSSNNVLRMVTLANSSGVASVKLAAEDYEEGEIKAYAFSDMGLRVGVPNSRNNTYWSNVLSGYLNGINSEGGWDYYVTNEAGKFVVFGYTDNPENVGVKVKLSLVGLVTTNNKNVYEGTPSTSATMQENFHEVILKTVSPASTDPVQVKLSAIGHMEETKTYRRYIPETNGEIRKVAGRNSGDIKVFNVNNGKAVGFTKDNPTFVISGYWRVTLDQIDAFTTQGAFLQGGTNGRTAVITVQLLKEDYDISLVRLDYIPSQSQWSWKTQSGSVKGRLEAKVGDAYTPINGSNAFFNSPNFTEYFYYNVPDPEPGNPGPSEVKLYLTLDPGEKFCLAGMTLQCYKGTFQN